MLLDRWDTWRVASFENRGRLFKILSFSYAYAEKVGKTILLSVGTVSIASAAVVDRTSSVLQFKNKISFKWCQLYVLTMNMTA